MKSIKASIGVPQPLNKGQVVDETKSQVKLLEEQLMKFSDLLIASTSLDDEELKFWEPRTQAPYEPLLEKKFSPAPNTLNVSPDLLLASHAAKTTMSVWRWDKKEPVLRFPLKEQLSVVRMVNSSGLCLGGSKQSGRLSVWEMCSG